VRGAQRGAAGGDRGQVSGPHVGAYRAGPLRVPQQAVQGTAAISPDVAETRKRWQAGHGWHADIEALRVIHPGLRTLGDWLGESGAAALRAQRTAA
jgi:hypothetical protein